MIFRILLWGLIVSGFLGCLKVKDKNRQSSAFPASKTGSSFDLSVYSTNQILVIRSDYAAPIESAPLDWRQYKVIQILNSAQITLQGRDLLMAPDIFESERGVIRSFAPGAQAAQGQGRDGSHLEIYLKDARGEILFDLDGEDGSAGAAGTAHTQAAANGRDAEVPVPVPGLGRACIISISAENGKDGLPGRAGQNGYKGGDSGTLNLHENVPGALKYSLQAMPGTGGLGGAGGTGQEGGQGGRYLGICADLAHTHPTKSGARGPSGPAGENGKEGLHRMSCFYQQSKTQPEHCQ